MTAFNFDAACTYVFESWKNERDSKRMTLLIKSFAVIMGADKSILEDGDFADTEAEVW